MKIKVLELGTMVSDITNTNGMLTHLNIAMDETKDYYYQPRGLNPKTGAPVERIWLKEQRINGGKFIEIDAPLEILGSKAEDIATGFKGKIVALIYHLDGCLHVEIKPEGVLEETGATIATNEFDIRRVKGDKIKPFGAKKLKESIKDTPSPNHYTQPRNS